MTEENNKGLRYGKKNENYTCRLDIALIGKFLLFLDIITKRSGLKET